MDLQNIQDQLNTEFTKSSVKYIFWFDDKAEYEDEVSERVLTEAKLHILDGSNWFYSKWLLYELDPDSKYLIYVPFAADIGQMNLDQFTDNIISSLPKIRSSIVNSRIIRDQIIPEYGSFDAYICHFTGGKSIYEPL